MEEVIDTDFEPFAIWSSPEGEEHIPRLLAIETQDGGNINLATDTRVPGRIKGHDNFYRSIGAYPYIVNLMNFHLPRSLKTINQLLIIRCLFTRNYYG